MRRFLFTLLLIFWTALFPVFVPSQNKKTENNKVYDKIYTNENSDREWIENIPPYFILFSLITEDMDIYDSLFKKYGYDIKLREFDEEIYAYKVWERDGCSIEMDGGSGYDGLTIRIIDPGQRARLYSNIKKHLSELKIGPKEELDFEIEDDTINLGIIILK